MTAIPMRTLVATDLTKAATCDDSWRRLSRVASVAETGPWTTPAGYRFAEGSIAAAGTDLHILVVSPGEMGACVTAESAAARGPVRLATPEGELAIELDRGRARLAIEPSAWSACTAPVLLAISIGWRLAEIERRLVELSEWSGEQLGPGRTRWLGGSSGKELDRRHREIKALVLDLPCCEGALDDAGAFFGSRDERRLFRRLVRRLGLDRWRTRVDERVEIVEAVVDSLVDGRRHRQGLRYAVILESLILAALVADIAIHLVSTPFE